jgi:hypothetical protein
MIAAEPMSRAMAKDSAATGLSAEARSKFERKLIFETPQRPLPEIAAGRQPFVPVSQQERRTLPTAA